MPTQAMSAKLTSAQRKALEFLAKEPWTASWWGGKPHSSWPSDMREQTYRSLRERGLVTSRSAKMFDVVVSITDTGRAALES